VENAVLHSKENLAGTMWARLGAFAKPRPGQSLQARPYSKQQVAKNNFTTEPIFFAIPDWRVVLYFYTVKQKASIQIMLVVNRLYI